jgi:hypothetical protein
MTIEVVIKMYAKYYLKRQAIRTKKRSCQAII